MEDGLYSNKTENPLADYWHVIVPYCSSDTWAGTGRSEVTGYYFHGKHIFRSDSHTPYTNSHSLSHCRDVLNSLSHHYDLFSATDFVLSGAAQSYHSQLSITTFQKLSLFTSTVVMLTVLTGLYQAAVLEGLVLVSTVTTWLTG